MAKKSERRNILESAMMSLRKPSAEKSVDSSSYNRIDIIQQGHMFKDETGKNTIFIDGIIASFCYAFDAYDVLIKQ